MADGSLNTGKENRYTAGARFVLCLDGIGEVGTLQSVSGGGLGSTGAVVGGERGRTLAGRPRFEDLTLKFGIAMAGAFWDWVNASLKNEPERRSGAILELSFDSHVTGELEFRDALLAEIGFPLLDASKPELPLLTVKIAAESMTERRESKRRRNRMEQESKDEWQKQRLWSTGNFTVGVDRFHSAPRRTIRVEPITIRQSIIEVPTGGFRTVQKEPGQIEFPKVEVTLLSQDSQPWSAWYKEFVEDDTAAVTQGHVSLLSSKGEQQKPLMTIHLNELALSGLRSDERSPEKLELRRMRAELQCESMRVEIHSTGGVGA